LTCAGQTPVARTVAAGQVLSIVTGWSAGCSSLGVSSSNGWDTNFDDLVID